MGDITWRKENPDALGSILSSADESLIGYALTIKVPYNEELILTDMLKNELQVETSEIDNHLIFKTGSWKLRDDSLKPFSFINPSLVFMNALGDLNDKVIIRDINQINSSLLEHFLSVKLNKEPARYAHLPHITMKKTGEPISPSKNISVKRILNKKGISKHALLAYAGSIGFSDSDETMALQHKQRLMTYFKPFSKKVEEFNVAKLRVDNSIYSYSDLRFLNKIALRNRLRLMNSLETEADRKASHRRYFKSIVEEWTTKETSQFLLKTTLLGESDVFNGIFGELYEFSQLSSINNLGQYPPELIGDILKGFTLSDLEYMKEFLSQFRERFEFIDYSEREFNQLISEFCYSKAFPDSIVFLRKLKQITLLSENCYLKTSFIVALIGKNEFLRRLTSFLKITDTRRREIEAIQMKELL